MDVEQTLDTLYKFYLSDHIQNKIIEKSLKPTSFENSTYTAVYL